VPVAVAKRVRTEGAVLILPVVVGMEYIVTRWGRVGAAGSVLDLKSGV